MRIEIDDATPEQIFEVAYNMRDRDFTEFTAISAFDDREALAESLAARYGDQGMMVAKLEDGTPVCIGGVIEMRPNVGSLLFMATDEFPAVASHVAKFIRRRLFPGLRAAGVHRLEAITLEGYVEVHRWMRTLGLSQETEPLKGYGKRGEGFLFYAWTAESKIELDA